jgi:hypothetical protein
MLILNGVPVSRGGSAGAPGDGAASIPFSVPNDPALDGFELFWQLVTVDPAGPAGFAMSEGFALRFCR